MNMKQTLLAIAVSALAGNALAGFVPVYECQGSFSWDQTDVAVELDEGWEFMTTSIDFDSEAGCDTGGEDGVACTKKGNTITSSIDQAGQFSTDPTATLGDSYVVDDMSGLQHVTVHADIFMPGDCDVGVAETDTELCGDPELLTDTCYDSGDEWFTSAAAACADALSDTGEGMYAGDGDGEASPFSENRHPKTGRNKSWSMFVDLGAPATCSGPTDATDTGGACDTDALVQDAIADGGSYGQADAIEDIDYLNVGTVTFTPDDDCDVVCTNCEI